MRAIDIQIEAIIVFFIVTDMLDVLGDLVDGFGHNSAVNGFHFACLGVSLSELKFCLNAIF
jgi:hypothetical protein